MSTKSKTIRCSRLPLYGMCEAAIQEADIDISTTGKAARIGLSVHHMLDHYIKTSEHLDIPNVLQQFDLDDDSESEIGWLYHEGVNVFDGIENRLDDISTEKALSATIGNVYLTGHIDLLAIIRDEVNSAIVLDWKTGYRESNYLDQLKGYALLANEHYPDGLEKITVVTAFLRLGIVDTVEIKVSELQSFKSYLMSLVSKDSYQYSPSEYACLYCHHRLDCPARRKMISAAGNNMLAISGEQYSLMTPEKMAELYTQSRVLKSALEDYENALREVLRDNGSIAIDDGTELFLEERTRQTLKWCPQFMQRYLSMDQISEMLPTIGKKELLDAVAANVARGKTAVKNRCLEDMKEFGLIEEKSYHAIGKRKIQGQEESK